MTPRCPTCGAELRPTFEPTDQSETVRHTDAHRQSETVRSVWKCPYCDGILDAARREYEALLKTIDAILKGRGEG